MTYRLPPRPERRAHIRATATQSVICVDNDTISKIDIPCFYRNDRVYTWIDMLARDHAGWPSPDKPDRSFQPNFHDEIDLVAEGYDSASMEFLDPPEGLSATGEIDENIIKVTIDVSCESAVTEDVDVTFSIYVTGDGLRSLVTKGTLHIVAGLIGQGE